VLLHDRKKSDNNLGGRSDEDLERRRTKAGVGQRAWPVQASSPTPRRRNDTSPMLFALQCTPSYVETFLSAQAQHPSRPNLLFPAKTIPNSSPFLPFPFIAGQSFDEEKLTCRFPRLSALTMLLRQSLRTEIRTILASRGCLYR
jgi:hypothetical protein